MSKYLLEPIYLKTTRSYLSSGLSPTITYCSCNRLFATWTPPPIRPLPSLVASRPRHTRTGLPVAAFCGVRPPIRNDDHRPMLSVIVRRPIGRCSPLAATSKCILITKAIGFTQSRKVGPAINLIGAVTRRRRVRIDGCSRFVEIPSVRL